MSKIKVEGVSYIYGAKTPYEIHALDSVSLEICENRITGIIGHTGSGKSTLVSMLNGLTRPTSGKIYLDGVDIWKGKRLLSGICRRVGLVMQYPEYQLFEDTVHDDIAFGPKNMGLTAAETEERVLDACAFVGLDSSLLGRSPFDLSGGQKRRVAIAGIMAMKPEILVLDEPASGLDPMGRRAIFEGICKYAEGTGAAVIIVSHSMEDMARYCDDVIVMSHGRVFMQGTRDEVFSRAEELEGVGLDIPEVTRIMMLLRERGLVLPQGIYTTEDAYRALLPILGGGI